MNIINSNGSSIRLDFTFFGLSLAAQMVLYSITGKLFFQQTTKKRDEKKTVCQIWGFQNTLVMSDEHVIHPNYLNGITVCMETRTQIPLLNALVIQTQKYVYWTGHASHLDVHFLSTLFQFFVFTIKSLLYKNIQTPKNTHLLNKWRKIAPKRGLFWVATVICVSLITLGSDASTESFFGNITITRKTQSYALRVAFHWHTVSHGFRSCIRQPHRTNDIDEMNRTTINIRCCVDQWIVCRWLDSILLVGVVFSIRLVWSFTQFHS